MQLGDWQLDTVDGGAFRIDGGVMFGVVPRSLWQTVAPPDPDNRVPCANHCVLARNGRHTVLVDTGYGGGRAPLDRKFYALDPGEPLVDSLAALGVSPDDIDTVVFTHLHWDHVGGAVRRDRLGRLVPVFPGARHVVSRLEWEDATSARPELQTAYTPDHFLPLEQAGQLALIDDNTEIVRGIRACITGGHTRGHMAIRWESPDQMAIYLGDICPSTAHLRPMWCTAYDTHPIETRRRKPQILGEAADRDAWILWNHDPQFAASRLRRHPKREFVVLDPRARL